MMTGRPADIPLPKLSMILLTHCTKELLRKRHGRLPTSVSVATEKALQQLTRRTV
jgi:hypothetical protein